VNPKRDSENVPCHPLSVNAARPATIAHTACSYTKAACDHFMTAFHNCFVVIHITALC
jgi:hypothetical protein